MQDRETPRTHKYLESKTTRITFRFLLNRVYLRAEQSSWRYFNCVCNLKIGYVFWNTLDQCHVCCLVSGPFLIAIYYALDGIYPFQIFTRYTYRLRNSFPQILLCGYILLLFFLQLHCPNFLNCQSTNLVPNWYQIVSKTNCISLGPETSVVTFNV